VKVENTPHKSETGSSKVAQKGHQCLGSDGYIYIITDEQKGEIWVVLRSGFGD
jgi:hypothetical protein